MRVVVSGWCPLSAAGLPGPHSRSVGLSRVQMKVKSGYSGDDDGDDGDEDGDDEDGYVLGP